MPAIRATFREDNTLEAVLIEENENNLKTTLANEVVIKGANVYMNTVEYWNSNPLLIAKDKAIYVYTNYDEFEGQAIPGIKVGDGKAYLIDIPFISGNKDAFEDHIRNSTIHVTQEEKDFWNNKNRAEVVNDETLMFTIY